MQQLPIAVQNATLALDVKRKMREIDDLKSQLAGNYLNSEASLSSSTSSSSTSNEGSFAHNMTESSLSALATILSMSQEAPTASAPAPELSEEEQKNAADLLEIEHITLNVQIGRMNREIEHLRTELYNAQAVVLPKTTKQNSFSDSSITLLPKDPKSISAKLRKPRGSNKKVSSEFAFDDLSTEDSSQLLLSLSQKPSKDLIANPKTTSKTTSTMSSKTVSKITPKLKTTSEEATIEVEKVKVKTKAVTKWSKSDIPLSPKEFLDSQSLILVPTSRAAKKNQSQESLLISSWDLCSFVVKRLYTDVTNFKYNLKRKHHDHSITQIQSRYYVCKECYKNTRSIEVLHHASLDYVKFITLHFKKEHKGLVDSSENEAYLPYIISIPIPNEIISIIVNTSVDTSTFTPDTKSESSNVYTKMKSILNNEDGIEKKLIKKCIEDVLKCVESQLERYKLARLDVYIINYMERMPVAKEDVRELLDVNASNYYAYFSAVEQISGSKETLCLEQDYYDDIDNFNDHININNRENTTKIKKYNTKKKQVPSYVVSNNQDDIVVVANGRTNTNYDYNSEQQNLEAVNNDIILISKSAGHPDSDSDSDSEGNSGGASYQKRKMNSYPDNEVIIAEKKQRIAIEKSDGNFIFIG